VNLEIQALNSNILLSGNCIINLYKNNLYEKDSITKMYHNTVLTSYLKQFALEMIGDPQEFDTVIKVIELRDDSDNFITRKIFNDTWNTAGSSTFVNFFNKTESNANIRTIKYFCGDDCTTAEGTGEEVSSVAVTVDKTSEFNMNILYVFGFQNA